MDVNYSIMENRIQLEKQNKPNDQITELILDNCRASQISGLTDEFVNLEFLSIINVGLVSLKGFPKLPNLKKLELSDNRLTGGLNLLHGCPKLQHLNISGNRIKDLEALEPLKEFHDLVNLDLYNCEVTKVDDYRKKVFDLLPNLHSLDGYDRNEREVADDDEDSDEDEGSDVENRITREDNDDLDDEEDDDDENSSEYDEDEYAGVDGYDEDEDDDDDDDEGDDEEDDDDDDDDEEEDVDDGDGDYSNSNQPDISASNTQNSADLVAPSNENDVATNDSNAGENNNHGIGVYDDVENLDDDDDVVEEIDDDDDDDDDEEEDEEDGSDLKQLQKDIIDDDEDDEEFEPSHEIDERDHEIDPEDDGDEDEISIEQKASSDVSEQKVDANEDVAVIETEPQAKDNTPSSNPVITSEEDETAKRGQKRRLEDEGGDEAATKQRIE